MALSIINFLHHLFDPHCPHCKEELEADRIREDNLNRCNSCQVLTAELIKAQTDKDRLLAALIEEKK